MAIEFLTGQRLTADLLNENVIDFLPVTYTKDVATARTSTTTLADDPELSGIPLGVGTWEIEVLGYFHTTADGTQGIKTRWAFTGTWNSSGGIRSVIGPGSDNAAASNQATTINTRGNLLDGVDATYKTNATSAFTQFREISRNVVVTVAGNMSLQWAQSISDTDATTLDNPSTVTVRKINN